MGLSRACTALCTLRLQLFNSFNTTIAANVNRPSYLRATRPDGYRGPWRTTQSIATMSAVDQDALLLLRQSIAAEKPMIPVASPDSTEEAPLATATHLQFPHPKPAALLLEAPTRFFVTIDKAEVPVDLRSIYFAWVNRDLLIPEYNTAATRLNEELAASGSGATVHKLTFVERVNLITWIEGGGESEYIKALPGEREPGSAAAEALKSASAPATASGRAGRGQIDPRLQVIYAGERKMGDRNSVLRGHKLVVSAACLSVATATQPSRLVW